MRNVTNNDFKQKTRDEIGPRRREKGFEGPSMKTLPDQLSRAIPGPGRSAFGDPP